MNPIFSNVLSCDVDLPDLPWAHKPMGRVPRIRGYRKRMNESRRKPDEMTAGRSRFSHSVISFPPKSATEHPSSSSGSSFIIRTTEKPICETQKSVQVETRYRESSAQTDPWEPPVKIIGRGEAEILTMEFDWGSGLPISPRAVEAIERARMKAAWMKIIKPKKNDERSLNTFSNLLLALEVDEWKYRENQIDKIQNIRLRLLEGVIENVHKTSNTHTEKKMARIVRRMEEELEQELRTVKRETGRDLRRHEARRKVLHKQDEAHISKTPLRKRQDAKRWHKVIDEKVKTYQPQFIGAENISTAPKWLKKATLPKKPKYTDIPNKREIDLCIRETKWRPDLLLSLQIQFKNKQNRPLKKDYVLLTPKSELTTTQISDTILNNMETQHQCTVLVQNIVTGNTTQLILHKNPDNDKELDKDKNMVMGSLFDVLNKDKEQSELRDERGEQAICLVNRRERFTIKGPQQEILHEPGEMFEQINKVPPDVYSGNIITVSEVGSYIKTFFERIDSETEVSKGDKMTTEILNFSLPEAVVKTEKLQTMQDEIDQGVKYLEAYSTYQQLEEYKESVNIKSEGYDEDNTYSFVFRLLNEILEFAECSADLELSTLESILRK